MNIFLNFSECLTFRPFKYEGLLDIRQNSACDIVTFGSYQLRCFPFTLRADRFVEDLIGRQEHHRLALGRQVPATGSVD